MIKTIILTLFMMGTVLYADGQKEHKILSYHTSLSLFQTIYDDAIILGHGKKTVYVFIDPLCPHSRKFMTMVAKNPKMTSKYQYHIFLYSLPRLKSTDVVSAVYISPTPIKTLLQVMIEEKVQHDKGNKMTKARVNRVEIAAKEMGVYKRPYIFIVNGEGKEEI